MRRLWLLPALIILTVCVYFYGTGNFGFLDNYETLYINNINNEFNINYLLNSGAFFLFGRNEFAGRIFQAVFGIGGAFLAYLSAKYLYLNRKASHIAAFITLTSPLYFITSRLNVPDAFFAFFFTLAIFGYIYKKFNYLIFYIGMALATLSGGFIRGFIAPLIIITVHILALNGFKNSFNYKISPFRNIFSLLGAAVYILIILPVFFYNKNFFNFNFNLYNNAFFISGVINDFKNNNFIFLLLIILAVLALLMPWCAFPALLKGAFKSFGGNFTISRDSAILTGSWLGVAFIFTLPNISACVIPASILIAAVIIDEIIEYPARNILRTSIFYALCIISFLMPLVYISAFNRAALTKSHKDIAAMAIDYLKYENKSEISLYAYGKPMPSLNFYLKRNSGNDGIDGIKIENININSEVDINAVNAINRRIRRIWNGAAQTILIVRRKDVQEFRNIIGREPVKVGESSADFMFTNY